jgi:hypothetical protein
MPGRSVPTFLRAREASTSRARSGNQWLVLHHSVHDRAAPTEREPSHRPAAALSGAGPPRDSGVCRGSAGCRFQPVKSGRRGGWQREIVACSVRFLPV